MTIPARVGGYQASAINALIDHVKMITPRSNAQIRVNMTTGGTTFQLPKDIDPPTDDFPWRVTIAPTEVRVTEGSIYRCGTSVTLTPDVGETYQTIPQAVEGPWEASTTYYIYYTLSSSLYNPATRPTSISVSAAKNPPTDNTNFWANIHRVIAVVTTDADANLATVTQTWWGGNPDDVAVVPDGEGLADSGVDYKLHSINYVADSSTRQLHRRDLQIFEWDDPTIGGMATDDLFIFQDTSTDNKYLRYTSLQSLADYITINANYDDGGGDAISIWMNENYAYWHTALSWDNFTGGDTDIEQEAIGTGKSNGNTDHDDAYWHAFNDGSGSSGHDTFVDSKTYKTSGLLEITNTTASSAVAGAILTAGGVSAANMYATAGITALRGGASQAGYFSDGNRLVSLGSDGGAGYFEELTASVSLTGGGGAYAGQFVNTGSIVSIADVDYPGIDVNTGDYYHAGNQGNGTGQQVQIPLAGGGFVTCYLRGGILCAS